ncbi:hypothetical protein HPB51_022573 [Rhipicephalus microplus]|uniref:Tick transposon n=1 Tax=Rhipicephalus microplus TaxID=6941 RepID=A0A9J6DK00_RHIMP|nr:hypothetical protein HPB51_022573 [Rhipicephalus microplus]
MAWLPHVWSLLSAFKDSAACISLHLATRPNSLPSTWWQISSPNCYHQQRRCCAICCPSKLVLARAELGGPIAQRIARKFVVIVRSECDVIFQWVPSHIGLRGNEAADALAKEAHHPSTPVSTFVRAGDVANFRIARHVRAFHPDSRVATENPPRPLPRTGIGRRARAFLRLRTDCSRTAELHFRRTNSGSPACAECRADETIEHVLLQCRGYVDQRWQLFDAYGRLGLPYVSLNQLRFPRAHRVTFSTMWTFSRASKETRYTRVIVVHIPPRATPPRSPT